MNYVIVNEAVIFLEVTILLIVISALKVGALWLRLALIILDLTIVLHRIDFFGSLFWGLDLINPGVTYLITHLAILSILLAFIAAYIRKPYLIQAERKRNTDKAASLKAREEKLETGRLVWERSPEASRQRPVADISSS